MGDIQHLLGQTKAISVGGKSLIISDGAMATLLHQTGVPVRTCCEELNLSAPSRVEEVHLAYLSAGCNVIQTNTFSAHRSGLGRYGLDKKVTDINRKGAQIALRAAQGKAAVYGTVGSIAGVRLYGAQLDAAQSMELRDEFEEQITALLTEPIQGLLLETFPDLEEMLIAIETVRKLTALPIVANLSPEEIGVTRDGIKLSEAFVQMRQAGATAVGLNCKLGPHGILRSYENMTLDSEGIYVAVPNAGYLHLDEGDYSYTGSADYFANVALQMVQLGVSWIGGCCGTTPSYIKRVREGLYTLNLKTSQSSVQAGQGHGISQKSVEIVSPEPTSASATSDARGENGEPAGKTLIDQVREKVTVIVELDPPKTLDCTKYLTAAHALKQAGADFITLADNSLGTIRVSNLALSSILKQHGIEPLVHVTCRDRNLIGQQSHLMGFNILGIHHVLLVTGDPSKFGDLPGATSVYDVSSIELTKMVRRLNEGTGFSGQALQKPAQFVIGTAFNPHVRNFDKAIARLRRKVEAGADYVMTQPVYDVRLLEKIHTHTADLGVPIFIGIMPLVSARNALFLHNEVPGIDIPEEILKRMQSVDAADAAKEGLNIAESFIEEALKYYRGIYLVTPFLRYSATVHLTKYIRARTEMVVGT